MCILLASTSHPDYPFVFLSNRDEYFKRSTLKAHVRKLESGRKIISPMDISREEHGTWIGVTDDGRIAILLNYREDERKFESSQLSRGILPTSFLTSTKSGDAWRETLQNEYNEEFKKIGGFTLLYGHLNTKGDTQMSILSNRDKHSKIFGGKEVDVSSGDRETIGVSNSLFGNPWKKVHLGVSLVDSLVEKSVQENYTQEKFVEKCFDILSHDTYNRDIASNRSFPEKMAELQNSIFIPPLKASPSTTKDSDPVDTYGTRTQTIILMDKSGHIHYYERDLDCSKDPSTGIWTVQHLDFKIKN